MRSAVFPQGRQPAAVSLMFSLVAGAMAGVAAVFASRRGPAIAEANRNLFEWLSLVRRAGDQTPWVFQLARPAPFGCGPSVSAFVPVITNEPSPPHLWLIWLAGP